MAATQELVEHADRLSGIFGRWPSFHDAEVLHLSLDRAGGIPTLELLVHVFEATSELDANGSYVLRNHTLVRLRFVDLVLEEIAGFNEQNVLFDLTVVEQSSGGGQRRLRVELSTSYGLSGSFECERAIVVEASPYEAAV